VENHAEGAAVEWHNYKKELKERRRHHIEYTAMTQL
jgi:hypothetical protein